MEAILLDHLKKIEDLLTSNGYKVSPHTFINYGLQFTLSCSGTTGVVRVYYSKKKGINPDLSQIASSSFFSDVHKLLSSLGYNLPNTSTVKENVEVFQDVGFPVIGTDESGKGDFFGPLVVAAVYVTEKLADQLKVFGVKDSKALSDTKILELAAQLEHLLVNKYVVVEISPRKYNDLYSKFKSQQQTLNSLLGWGHAKAIEELLNKVEAKKVIVDKFGDDRFVLDKLQEKGKNLEIIQRHKAESNIAVAAASIFARARFLTKLKRLSDQKAIALPKGAGDKVKVVANKIIELHGTAGLDDVAKTHFKMSLNT